MDDVLDTSSLPPRFTALGQKVVEIRNSQMKYVDGWFLLQLFFFALCFYAAAFVTQSTLATKNVEVPFEIIILGYTLGYLWAMISVRIRLYALYVSRYAPGIIEIVTAEYKRLPDHTAAVARIKSNPGNSPILTEDFAAFKFAEEYNVFRKFALRIVKADSGMAVVGLLFFAFTGVVSIFFALRFATVSPLIPIFVYSFVVCVLASALYYCWLCGNTPFAALDKTKVELIETVAELSKRLLKYSSVPVSKPSTYVYSSPPAPTEKEKRDAREDDARRQRERENYESIKRREQEMHAHDRQMAEWVANWGRRPPDSAP